ncbi:YbfB/YjiJ family MFS transporter [Streptomyces sp. SID13726]|uniref:YbfB/YjiJ family MFS transporter n=1 Tax=Streptomyces sp. SID13726 TaxID=2706058 RepID=UPI0013BC5ABF|nr:YbfB/YjiJ family MFS transporter [Streptomyces sp. SID13726]NEA99385.1 YbfB/YjiJ family MFS transporter [Streptomyces sp. SID13726]
MGVGRFVYTPILPLMQAQAELSAGAGADLATANYVGYLLGALAGILFPPLVRSRAVLRGSLLVLAGTLACMPLTHSTAVWAGLRLTAGAASALVFVVAAGSLLHHLRTHSPHLPGWAFGGVGAGIALSGLLVLVLRTAADWRAAWWASAALALALTGAAWNLRPEEATAGPAARPGERTHRWFWALFVGYTLEGAGYIVAGTFLVAAIGQGSPGWVGGAAWVLVGLAAVPSTALWARLARRRSRPDLLLAALLVQAVGIALPALVGGAAAALVSAVLFGATFLGICTLALATGAQLRFPRSVALLTAGYSVGQILGPPAVAPMLHDGYRSALLLAALVVLVSAAVTIVLRFDFPHHMAVTGGSRRESTQDTRPDRPDRGALAPHSAD